MGSVTSAMSHSASDCRLVAAHGAGSEAAFLAEAFPADVVGVLDTRFVDDRTGRIGAVMSAIAAAATPDRPAILGGVSLGAHAAARLLARADRPSHVVAGLLVMPAWTGSPERVANMTGAAAEALEVLGPTGVLAELDPDDWVTPLLQRAWSRRRPAALVAELRMGSRASRPHGRGAPRHRGSRRCRGAARRSAASGECGSALGREDSAGDGGRTGPGRTRDGPRLLRARGTGRLGAVDLTMDGGRSALRLFPLAFLDLAGNLLGQAQRQHSADRHRRVTANHHE